MEKSKVKTINLPVQLHNELKSIAALNGIALNKLIEKLLRIGLENYESDNQSKK